jgi:hypothetical protein
MSLKDPMSRAAFFGHLARAASLLLGAGAAGEAAAVSLDPIAPGDGRGGLSKIDWLEAIEELKLLHSRRDRAVDMKDWDTLEALHAPEHHSYVEGLPPWTSRDEMMRNIRASAEGMVTVHQCHTPDITFASPTRARGIWGREGYLTWKQGAEDHWMHNYGFYDETYEKRGGRWLFTSRREVTLRSERSPGAVIPKPKA